MLIKFVVKNARQLKKRATPKTVVSGIIYGYGAKRYRQVDARVIEKV